MLLVRILGTLQWKARHIRFGVCPWEQKQAFAFIKVFISLPGVPLARAGDLRHTMERHNVIHSYTDFDDKFLCYPKKYN